MSLLVYVAGPYTSGESREANREAAEEAARSLRRARMFPVVPHSAFSWAEGDRGNYPDVLLQCIALLNRCDAVLRLPGESPGADAEVAFAVACGKPVYTPESMGLSLLPKEVGGLVVDADAAGRFFDNVVRPCWEAE